MHVLPFLYTTQITKLVQFSLVVQETGTLISSRTLSHVPVVEAHPYNIPDKTPLLGHKKKTVR